MGVTAAVSTAYDYVAVTVGATAVAARDWREAALPVVTDIVDAEDAVLAFVKRVPGGFADVLAVLGRGGRRTA